MCYVSDVSNVRNPIVVFDENLFKLGVQKQYEEFIERFMDSNVFVLFQHKLEEEIQNSLQPNEIAKNRSSNQIIKDKYMISQIKKEISYKKRRNSLSNNKLTTVDDE